MALLTKVAAASVVVTGALTFASQAAFGQSSSAGAVNVWVTPSQSSNGHGKILFTGAIGDYGTTRTVNASGKASSKGNYGLAILSKGTILVNLSQFNAATNNANPTPNSSNCSVSFSTSAPVQIVRGTGAYAGITGSVTFNADFAGIFPKTGNGSCNGNANPKAQFITITGSGTVSF